MNGCHSDQDSPIPIRWGNSLSEGTPTSLRPQPTVGNESVSGAPALSTRTGTMGQSPHPQRVKVALAHKMCMIFLREAVTPARGHPAFISLSLFSEGERGPARGRDGPGVTQQVRAGPSCFSLGPVPGAGSAPSWLQAQGQVAAPGACVFLLCRMGGLAVSAP